MSEHFANWDENTFDLAVDQVTIGLEPDSQTALFSRVARDDFEEFEHVVAALSLAALEELEAPPAEVVRRLEESARGHFGPERDTKPSLGGTVEGPRPMGTLLSFAGWLAAAVLLIALFLREFPAGPASPNARLEALVASAPDLIQVNWSPTEDPTAKSASGAVVWSTERQEGYMTFQNLTPNDPARNQYQLWIFDSSRDDWEAKPVDGGVFDVGPDGEVVVPIDAKLAVREATLFAVTLEVPGGVVVSKRERLIVTASI